MAEEKGNKIPVTLEEITISNMWEMEALRRILIKKNIITQIDLDNEILQIKEEHEKYLKDNELS